MTSDQEHHWTALVPLSVLKVQLGEEVVESLGNGTRSISVDPAHSHALCLLVCYLLAHAPRPRTQLQQAKFDQLAQSKLLTAINVLILNAGAREFGIEKQTTRSRAYAKARRYLQDNMRPISVDLLASQVNVSRRCLEIGFRESLGISPQAYMQRMRLNAMHRELRQAARGELTVTAAAEKWGFTELGRTAGRYKEMFGELPSQTLQRNSGSPRIRFADILAE